MPFVKGNKINLGRHHSIATRLKLSELNKGNKINCGRKLTDEHKFKLNLAKKGYRHSVEAKKKMKLNHKNCRKEKSPRWKGGRTKVAELIRMSLKYKIWRQQVFIRDNFICQKCGYKKGGNFEAHHKKQFSVLLNEVERNLPLMDLYEAAMIYTPLWDTDNGITYCKKCHSEERSKII